MKNKSIPFELSRLRVYRNQIFNLQSPIFNLKKLSLISILIFASHLSHAQKLFFCEHVDSSTGTPRKPSTTFTISSGGGFLNVLVTMPNGINSSSITYDIFRLNETKAEIFESTIRQDVSPEYTWFSKEITFHIAGNYNVYVYDDKEKLLCVGRVTIKIE